MTLYTPTRTPLELFGLPQKSALVHEFEGKPLAALRTPAMIIDRKLFAQNCAKMHQKAESWGAKFRAHLKSHKTAEGCKLQLRSSMGKSDSVVVSTLSEAWEVVKAGLVKEGIVRDILYGLPIGPNKIADLSSLWDEITDDSGIVRVLVDHPKQVQFLEEYENASGKGRKWSVFVKVNGGQNRAGVPPTSQDLKDILSALFRSPSVSVYGFYGHNGDAYASTSLDEATSFLSSEVRAVDAAAKVALSMLPDQLQRDVHKDPFVLSVGSTPSAHAASEEARRVISQILHGQLELHAGNYPLLDLQQQHTNLINSTDIAQRVRATVVSYYPGRGARGEDEALVDAGAIAFSKDSGPSGGYGDVIGRPWRVGRISQEHGILTRPGNYSRDKDADDKLEVGDQVEIIGQHACLISAAYPWYYIVDKDVGGGEVVVDVWVPWKGW